jgi:exonuclease SbcD
MDINGYGYSPEIITEKRDAIWVHVAHGMLLDHEPPFDRFTLIGDVRSDADLILTGHDHLGYGVVTRNDGKVFCNPGSITRISASISEIERPIQIAKITFNDNKKFEIELLRLESAKPGPEVLDRSVIETEQKREYAMEQFTALVKTTTGESISLNINQVIEQIAKKEHYAPDVVKMALDKIDLCRSMVRV